MSRVNKKCQIQRPLCLLFFVPSCLVAENLFSPFSFHLFKYHSLRETDIRQSMPNYPVFKERTVSHLHVIYTDGCFYGNGSFKACPKPNPKDLEDLFRYEVFKMLKSEGKINDLVIENMMNWRHSGFNV